MHRKLPKTVLLIATNVSRRPQPSPFDDPATTASYAHLADLCANLGLDLQLAHFANLHADGVVLGWRRRGPCWRPAQCFLADVDLAYADLPQNFPEALALKEALIAHRIPTINALRLSDLLTDKIAAHDFFSEHVPATWNAAAPDLADRIQVPDLHPDLDAERLFLKPRFGERGRGISVTDPQGLATCEGAGRPDYVVQAFLETGSGIPELGIEGRHDLRLIICDGRVELCFARVPQEGSLVSNCAQGGREIPLSPDRLPKRATDFAAQIDARLSDFGPRLYSLDLGVGRSGKIWIYELNTMPGIAWDDDKPENRSLHEGMHRLLAGWLGVSCAHQINAASIFCSAPSAGKFPNLHWIDSVQN